MGTHQYRTLRDKATGFTIIELLVVIVVIGILAAITLVAFNGVSQRAYDSALKSDLANSATILAKDLAESTINQYPATAAAANGGKGLPSGNGTTYVYTPNNTGSPTYTLTAANAAKSPNTYSITNSNTSPTLVTATLPVISSPASAVAYNTGGCGPAPGYYQFTLSSTGTGSPSPTIQWQRMTPINSTTGTWNDISGGTSSLLFFDGTGIISDGSYELFRVKYTNTAGTATSPIWTVTITNGC